MADERIQIDVSGALAEISKLKGGMVDAQAQAAKTGDAINKAFNVVGSEGAKGVSDALNDLQKEYAELKRSADTLKSALKSATDPRAIDLYVKSIAQLELGMQKLERAGKAAGVNLKEMSKQAGTGKQVFGELFGAFTKASLIAGALIAVKNFVQGAVELAQQVNTAKRSFEAFTGSAAEAEKIVNSLIATGQKNFIPTDDILSAGKALLAFGENADDLPAVLERIANVSAATGKNFNELALIYGKARTSGVLYAEDINQLVDAGIPIIQEFAKQMGVSNDQTKKLASEGKISFEELQLAMFNLTAEGGKFADQTQVQAQTIGGAWTRLVSIVQPAIESIGGFVSDVVSGALNLLGDLAQGVKNLFSDIPDVSPETLDKEQMYADRREYENELKERERIEAEAAKKRKSARSKTAKELEAIEKAREDARINGMQEGVEKEVAVEELRYKRLLKELRKYHLDTTDATIQHEKNLQKIRLDEFERVAELQQRVIELRKKIYEQDTKNFEKAEKDRADNLAKQRQELEDARDLKDLEIDIQAEAGAQIIDQLKRDGKAESKIKEAQKALDLETQKARLQNELEFQLAFLQTIENGDTARLNATIRTIDLIKSKIKGIDADLGGSAGQSKGLLERLGFDDEDIERFQEAARTIIDSINEITAANVAAAEEDLRIAQEKTQAAEDALEAEKKRQEDGFSSNVTLRQKELDQAKADEAKALTQKKEAQRQQLALDTALQLSGLITTSVNILKGWSTIPFVGQALGVTAIAAMFAAFAATKARAFAATKFRHGGEGRVDNNGIIVGDSHEGKGVGIEAEGGEFFGTDGKRFGIVNKKMTATHFDLLAAVNRNDKAGMVAAVNKIAGSGKVNQAAVTGAMSDSYETATGGSGEMYRMLKDWKKKATTRTSRTTEGGYVVEKTGSHTRKIRIKKAA